VDWTLLLEALLLVAAAGVVFASWMQARLRDRRATRALRVSEERFRNLTALSADWFWESDTEHRITWLTGGPTVLGFFGSGLAFGKRLWELPGVELDGRAFTAHLEQLHRRLPFFELELARADAAGLRHTHLVSGQPRHDAAGAFLGYRGVGRDVTERRRGERELADAKQRLELALEGGSLAVWDCEVASDRIYLSDGWARLLGEKPEARVAQSADLVALVHPQDAAATRAAFMAALKGVAPAYHVEYRLRTAEGGWRWVLSTGRVTERDGAGRALRISGVAADIDARKRAEQAGLEAEERYRSLVELTPNGVIVHCNGVIEYANAAAARILKAPMARDLLGIAAAETIHPEQRARFGERMQFLQAGPGSLEFEERLLRCRDGTDVAVEVSAVSYLERGRLVVQSVLRDVTEQQKARAALAEREQRFRDVVDASGEYVWETDAEWRYTYLSARVEAVLGYMRADLLGRTPREFMPLGESRAMDEWFERNAREGQPFRDLQHRSITRAGKVIWQQVSGTPVRDAAGRVTGYRGTGADITARKQAEERIQYLATRDALTGLPNRALLADRAGQAILAAARSRGMLAVLLFDLDRFKLVNDSLGHQAGDALLRAVAERLQNTLRREDTLARLGGDEYVLLWDGLKGAPEAALVAQRIQGILQRPFVIEGRTLNVTASIGISIYPEDGRDFNELLKNADTAMYDAKDGGRNGMRYFSPQLHARAEARLSLESDLRGALARNELLLHWQPVVRGGGIVGAEALVRWNHPQRGLLGPDAFIPAAEESGLIRAIGEWTLDRALSQVGAWQRSLPGEPWFALNVSALELAQGDAYVARLGEALRVNGVPAARLELEVTERVLMAHLPENIETLRRIGAMGVRLAIDDFGTGYSSLAYLRRLPIDKLKIDRGFLRELAPGGGDAMIVQTIAAMARGLGLQVAAEGVETEAQRRELLAVGCAEWQGHLFSPPLEAAAFERLALEPRQAAAG
jgi:diguanylate cyclase (GGDEF)-like protein/PAS domain S-box-containing protein